MGASLGARGQFVASGPSRLPAAIHDTTCYCRADAVSYRSIDTRELTGGRFLQGRLGNGLHDSAQRPRLGILPDTNVWRYLIDAERLEDVYRAARKAGGVLLACPAVLYEMLRVQNSELRRKLVRAISRDRWLRMMPEVFEESMELVAVLAQFRPEWLLAEPDRRSFARLRADWAGRRGVWWRARTDPDEAATTLRAVEGDHLDRARTEAYEMRTAVSELTNFDHVTLDRWTTTFPLRPPGWE